MNVDSERLQAKLNDITRSIARLKSFQSMERRFFLEDEDSQDIARSRLLTAIEAALNICYHVAAKRLQCVPQEYAQCFLLLGENNLIPKNLAHRLAVMARFRNRLVHLYWDIDYAQVYDIIKDDLGDLESFVHEVGSWF